MYFYLPVGVPVGPVSIIDLPESNTMVFNTVGKLLPVVKYSDILKVTRCMQVA